MSDRSTLAAYRAAVWTLDLPHAGPVRLRLPGPAPAALRPSGIVTAYNPASALRTARENALAHRRLRAELRRRGLRWLRCVADAPDTGSAEWREPGFCVLGCARDTVVALGARSGQNAVVWIDADGLAALVATRDGFAGCRVGEVIGPR